jgi:hypothetical protein
MPKNVPASAWVQGIRAAVDVGPARTSGEGFCVFQLSVFVHLAEVVLRLNITRSASWMPILLCCGNSPNCAKRFCR